MKKFNRFISVILAGVLAFAIIPFIDTNKAEAAGRWNASWATSMVSSSINLSGLNFQDIIPAGTTLRTELKITTAGTKIRIKLSNLYGASPINIGAVSIAATDGEGIGGVRDKTMCAVTFNKQYKVTIPAGGTVVSDAMNYTTSPMDRLSVSMYFPELTYITTAGLANGRTFMNTRGLFTQAASEVYKLNLTSPAEINIGSGSITYHTIPFLNCIDTYNEGVNTQTAVFIGDSTLVNDSYYHFAKRIMDTGTRNIAVVNEAIVGNKLLNKGSGLIGNLYGDSLQSRFDRDALDLAGVKYVFVKIGLNDIIHQYTRSMASTTPKVSPADLINGYQKLIKRCHDRGIKIYFFSKTPWKGYSRAFLGQNNDLTWTQDIQNLCDQLDNWIKSNNGSDGYIDCSALANPADKYALCPSFTPDGAHLTEPAAIALADLIPLKYVGIANGNRTAAQIAGIDPYVEKKQIIEEMNRPTTTVPTTTVPTTGVPETTEVPATVPSTMAPVYTTQPSPTAIYVYETTTLPEGASINVEGETTTAQEIVSVYNPNNNTNVPLNTRPQSVKPDYIIEDEMPKSIGSKAPIGFVLILIMVIVISGAVIFMVMSKKKEEDYIN